MSVKPENSVDSSYWESPTRSLPRARSHGLCRSPSTGHDIQDMSPLDSVHVSQTESWT
ncbi:hypothetical protein GJAV_G00167550 [Gymnothorax javanicus]|nr:hypothetical protein GJAV_G00167550 [Gymnothorax javanicus]